MTTGLPSLELDLAHGLVRSHLIRTPLLHAHQLDGMADTQVHLKLENLQLTGSFKARGAVVKMGSLSPGQRRRGVVTCSSGNHGRAVSHMARILDIAATVCVPGWIDPAKLGAIRSDGAQVVLAGDSYDEAEEAAARIQKERGAVLVHPFDDLQVIAGQGTVGLEIVEEHPAIRTVVVPVSGGGLASGVGYAVKRSLPEARIVGVSARRAGVMVRSLEVGRPVELPERPTLASALSGGIGIHNRYTFRMVGELVDQHVLVSEEEIREAIRFAFTRMHLVVEGGGAVGLAALLAGKLEGAPGPVAVILSGGNLDSRRLAEIVKDPR